MSNTTYYDTPTIFLNQIQSGLVVSGNSNIQVEKSITSGDVLQSFNQSGTGKYELVTFRLERSDTEPLTGGVYTKVADMVRVELHVKYPLGPVYNASGALTTLETRLKDFKTTVKSGVWGSGSPPIPYLVSEIRPQAHEKLARASLVYRFRYIL